MGIIKALKLGFDYQRYDDDGNVVDMQRAVNDVNLDRRICGSSGT